LDEHLAGCPTCHEVFAETLRFALDEEAQGALPRTSPTVIPFVRRPAFRLAAVLAVAAGVFLAFQQLWRARSERAQPSLVAELAQAMGTTRFVEPRLTGGFQHGRLVILRSGDRPQGLDAHSPAVMGAVARIREKAEGNSSPEALGALAVTYLVSGDIGKAVKALESATAQDPKNPRLQSDLAAVYLVRASRLDEPADIPKALEAAEKAIEIENAPAEAWFNRALALEQLHLVDSARKAWEDFLERDSTSAWADEARKHIEELPPAQQSTIEEDRARVRTALAEGPAAIDRLADESPSILADYFLAELLPAWSDAYLTGHPSAPVLRTQAQQVGEAIHRTTGDALPRDAALALAAPPSGPSRDPPRLQAQGYKALHEAQRLHDLGQRPCDTFRESSRLLQDGGSPFAHWARERIVVACLYPKRDPSVLPELTRIEGDARRKQYGRLLGRALWMTALFHSDAGDFDRALQHYRRAGDVFRALRDSESQSSVALRLGFVLNASGDSRAGWRERLRALALLDTVKQPTRREEALFMLAVACWQDQLARGAVHALTALADATRRRDSPDRLAYALIWRGQVLHAFGQQERAATDLAAARSILSSAGDIAYADNIEAFADAAEGRILASAQPERALAHLQRAMRYFEPMIPSFVPALRVDVARVLRASGREGEAEAELDAAIRQIESQSSLGDAQQQALFFDYAAAAPFDEMVAVQLDARDDPLRALHYVERSRGRQLAASLLSRPRASPRTTASATQGGPAPLAPDALQRQLPAGAVLAYYVVLPDRVVAWTLNQEGSSFFRLSVAPDELEQSVAGYAFAIESEAPVSMVREQAARLFDDLVRPLLPALQGQDSVVLIPDTFLRSLPFASLWNRETGRYLVEDYRLAQSPNGSVFVRASAAAARSKPGRAPRLLAVGNPRLAPGSGLPRLPGSAIEATQIARLYADSELLLNAAATKPAFLAGLGPSDVVHFAGHATQGEAPGSGRLLLAPDPEARTGGVVRSDEIVSSHLERTRLVVLAGCRTATGERSRFEGVRGVTRPFLAAGVPMVVASLWDVDDTASRAFFLEFHRRFLAEGDAATSVRQAQLALLHGDDPVLAHPSKWAGFVSFGGLIPRGAAPASKSEPGL
jgi:CHAT domain-containing protein